MNDKEEVINQLKKHFNFPEDSVIPYFNNKYEVQPHLNDSQISWNKYEILAQLNYKKKAFDKFYEYINKGIAEFLTYRIKIAIIFDNLQYLSKRDSFYSEAILKSFENNMYNSAYNYLQMYKSEGYFILLLLSENLKLYYNDTLKLCSNNYKSWVHNESKDFFTSQSDNLLTEVEDFGTINSVIGKIATDIDKKTIDLLEKYYDEFIKINNYIDANIEVIKFIETYNSKDLPLVQKCLSKNEVIVEFWAVSYSRIIVFVISNEDFIVKDIDIDNYKRVDEILESFKKGAGLPNDHFEHGKKAEQFGNNIEYIKRFYNSNYSELNLEEIIIVFKDLYNTLIVPIIEYLNPFDIVYFVQHKFLHTLPLHALIDNNNILFIDKFKVCYLPFSNYILDKKKKNNLIWTKLTSVGNPNNEDNSLSLPFAEIEAYDIGKNLNLENKIFFTGNKACSHIISSIEPNSIFHFSGHGSGNKNAAIFSYLKFHDTIITGEELLLKQNNSFENCLIFLNGCQTGTKDWRSFDENYSLVSIFLSKGASFVVSSSWEIDDFCAYIFAKNFLVLLVNDKLDAVHCFQDSINFIRNITFLDIIKICEDLLKENYFDKKTLQYKKIIAFLSNLSSKYSEDKILNILLDSKKIDNLLLENNTLLMFIRDKNNLENKPYSHPHFWAAYQLSGF